jgi:thiamine biosynthesis lipoprotein ApbE
MPLFNINTKPLDLNKIWAQTPIPLKYLLIGAIMMITSYMLLIRKNEVVQLKELQKIEQHIETTFEVIDKFEDFQNTQLKYNEINNNNVENLHTLVLELNDNVNTKFNYVVLTNGKYNKDIVDKFDLINKSFDKLSKAYEPADNSNND